MKVLPNTSSSGLRSALGLSVFWITSFDGSISRGFVNEAASGVTLYCLPFCRNLNAANQGLCEAVGRKMPQRGNNGRSIAKGVAAL